MTAVDKGRSMRMWPDAGGHVAAGECLGAGAGAGGPAAQRHRGLPGGLLALVRRWTLAGAAGRIVCTIKFQGETDFAAAEAFAAIPCGRVAHLFPNKHELTFWWAAARE